MNYPFLYSQFLNPLIQSLCFLQWIQDLFAATNDKSIKDEHLQNNEYQHVNCFVITLYMLRIILMKEVRIHPTDFLPYLPAPI